MRAILLPVLLLVAGCPIGNDKYPKPSELTPDWLVEGPKVLAMRADPPEVPPGGTATFSSLVAAPGEGSLRLWLACPPDRALPGGLGCDPTDPDAFIGIEGVLPPTYEVPTGILDDVDPDDAFDGIYVTSQLTLVPEEYLQAGDLDPSTIDPRELRTATKRLVVSDSPTPNHNPEVAAWTVDGIEVDPASTVQLDPGQTYEIGVWLTDGSIEFYQHRNLDGDLEERVEAPYLKWYADSGTILSEASLYPYLTTRWTSPQAGDAPSSGSLWVVVRDRRGGTAWSVLRWTSP